MFTVGRPSDWEKEKLFVFRSLYSNVEIDSVHPNYLLPTNASLPLMPYQAIPTFDLARTGKTTNRLL